MYIYIYIDISSVALILSWRRERLVEQNATGTKTTFRTESIYQVGMDKKAVKYTVFMIPLISEGMGRRISKGIHGPESNQKACKLEYVREGWVLEVRGKRKLLDDSRSPKLSKKPKIHRFLDFPAKERVCQKSFERNLRGQKVVKKHINCPVFVKVESSKSVKSP